MAIFDEGPALSRSAGHGRPAAPVRAVHLGLGNFFRAHQAFYTDRAPDAAEWGIAAYTGRSAGPAADLMAQDGLYSLVSRSADGDRAEVVSSLTRVHAAADHQAWLDDLASPEVAVVTVTVTEAGYTRNPDGGLNRGDESVTADIATLRTDPLQLVSTAPARLVAGLLARRRADAGPLTVVPCDNLADNGPALQRVLRDMAEAVDPTLADWMTASVSVASTVVDRITPRPESDLSESVWELTGLVDRSPVVTEPFSEWMITGAFPGGRPSWDEAGAEMVDDVGPFERRKLWLLNGAHSLLAYAGPTRGHRTVADAAQDPACQEWVEEWWDEAVAHLPPSAGDLAAYRGALVERFGNHRIEHLLAQIAADGSLKLPIRILPVLRSERSAGRAATGATRVLAAWICHLRGHGVPVQDPAEERLRSLVDGPLTEAVARIVDLLDPALATDSDLLAVVAEQARELVPSIGQT